VNLMHFSQGWVQFGYRFSLDFAPWAILLVAIGLEQLAARARPARALAPTPAARAGGGEAPGARSIGGQAIAWLAVAGAVALVVVSIAVNFWGVAWGDALGW